MSKGNKAAAPLYWGLGGIATLALVLQVAPSIGIVNPKYFPPLDQILTVLIGQFATATFWAGLGSTIYGWLIGLAIASVLGIVLGILIASVPVVASMLSSTIEFLRPIPSVALVPLVVLLLGTGMQSTLVLVVYASLWPVLIQTMYGVQGIDSVARDTAQSYRLGRWNTITKVIWPSITPFVITGIRLSAAVALVLEVTGELVIGSPGIGKMITVAQASAATTLMFALVFVTALLGVFINIGARALEQKLLFWHASIRAEV